MDLHQAGNQPEWSRLTTADYNRWQRLAARTNAIVTPGNLLTVAGLLIALAGLLGAAGKHYWLALSGLMVGRLFDLADGWAAARTGTKSPLGELLDATVDKIITFAALSVLGSAGLVRWPAIVLLALPHAVIAVLASRAFLAGKRLHPSRAGKISMAVAWLAIISALLSYAAGVHVLLIPSYLLGAASFGLGLLALSGYLKTSLKSASV